MLCRAGWWLDAFMGVGNEAGGEAWTFQCPPGHRVVGYGGSAGEYVGNIRFHTARYVENLAG